MAEAILAESTRVNGNPYVRAHVTSDVEHILPKSYISGSYVVKTRVRSAVEYDVDIALKTDIGEQAVKDGFRALADKLCEEHQFICMDAEVLGGTPSIRGTRLSVGKVLSKLYLYGSVQAVVDIHEPHLSEEQVKDAIAYAQDFLEMACDPHETP